MDKYTEITEARRLLALPERATMEEIKTNYRELIRQWHPDRCKKPKKECAEMSARIVAAYRIIIDYCNNYKYSFSKEEVRHHLTEEDWWRERFGEGPMWGA